MKKDYIVTIETRKTFRRFLFRYYGTEAAIIKRFCELIEARQYNSIVIQPAGDPSPLMVYKMNFQ